MPCSFPKHLGNLATAYTYTSVILYSHSRQESHFRNMLRLILKGQETPLTLVMLNSNTYESSIDTFFPIGHAFKSMPLDVAKTIMI